MLKRLLSFILLLSLITTLCTCSEQTPPSDSQPEESEKSAHEVTIVVTLDFGKELVLERKIAIEPATTAIDALQMVAELETKYGGGFVSSINGISSEYEGATKIRKDWFFYINGIASSLGANDYILQDGDIEHWDFKDWSYQPSVPAIIGEFPQPFRSGYQDKLKPTVVVYEEPFLEEALSVVGKLEELGISTISTQTHGQLSDETKESSNLIIIAESENELVSELNGAHKRLGFYVYIEQNKLITLDAGGNLSQEFGAGCGLIQATQNSWHPNGIAS